MKIRAFITHKLKEKFSDCQDRFSINPDTKSVAVADGMSQSIFQKIWAQLLVAKYVEHSGWDPNVPNIEDLSKFWRKEVRNNIEEQRSRGIDPYRAENMLAEGRGACATLVGLRFEDNNSWSCDVLGDSSLIRINSSTGEIEEIYSSQEGKYDNYPDYYDSVKGEIKGNPKNPKGELTEDTVLLLVSDPFTEFINRFKEKEKQFPIKKLLELNSHEEYETYVDTLRQEGMHNDDSTLIIIEHDGSTDFNVEHQDNLDEMILSEQAVCKNNNEEIKANAEEIISVKNDVCEKPLELKTENYTQAEEPISSVIPIATANRESLEEKVLRDFMKHLKSRRDSDKLFKKFKVKYYLNLIEQEIETYIKNVLKK